MKIDIPFYKQPDPKGCVVATLRMALEYFGQKYTWEELNELVERKEGKWGSFSAAVVKLKKEGWDVKIIETFDFERYYKEGVKYFYKKYGKSITEETFLPNYDFEASKKHAKELLSLGIAERRKLSFKEIEQYLNEGYLVAVVVNSRMLTGNEGFMAHAVLITGIDDENVWFHDSSFSSPQSNKKMNKKMFIKAHQDKGTDDEVILFKK